MPPFEAPTHLRSLPAAEMSFVWVELAMLLAAAIWALRRRRNVFPILLVIVAGAGLASFVEPLDDVASRLWFATNMRTFFGVYDRIYPIFFPPSYAVYYGLGTCGAYLVMRTGNYRLLLAYGIIGAAFDVVLEFFWIRTNLYDYYGPQPFEILGFPLYWAFINTAYLFVVGYVFYLIQHWLKGARLIIGLLIPSVGIGVLYGLAWPTWIAMNTRAPLWVMCAASLLTMAGSTLVVWLVSVAVHQYGSPLQLVPREKPAWPTPANAASRKPRGAAAK